MMQFTEEQVEQIVGTRVGFSPEGMEQVKVTGRVMPWDAEIRDDLSIEMTTSVKVEGETAEITTALWQPAQGWGFEILSWSIEQG